MVVTARLSDDALVAAIEASDAELAAAWAQHVALLAEARWRGNAEGAMKRWLYQREQRRMEKGEAR